jgi:hypothetical protein
VAFAPGARVAHGHDYDIKGLAKRCANEGAGWKGVGIRYSLADMILDMLVGISLLPILVISIFRVRGAAELLFPVLRPVMLYVGNNFVKEYVY